MFSKFFTNFLPKFPNFFKRSKPCLKTSATVQLCFFFSISFSTSSLNLKSQILRISSKILDLNSRNTSIFAHLQNYKLFQCSKCLDFLSFTLFAFFTCFLDFIGDFVVRSFHISCIHLVWNEWFLWAEQSFLENWPLISIDLSLRAKFCFMRADRVYGLSNTLGQNSVLWESDPDYGLNDLFVESSVAWENCHE